MLPILRKAIPIFILILLLIVDTSAQTHLDQQIDKTKQDLQQASRDYKASLEKVLVFQEQDVKTAQDMVEKRKALLAQHILEQKDVDDSIRLLEAAKAKVRETKKQIAEADSRLPQPQPKASRSPSPSIESHPNADAILLDTSDDRFIKDATTELYNLSLEMSVIDEHILKALRESQAILRQYCKCTDKEYEEYARGEGLPSVINRMSEQKLTRQDSNRFREAMSRVDNLKSYKAKRQTVFDSTMELFEQRMRQAFEKHGGVGIANYRLEVKARRFMRADDSLSVPSVKDSIELYLTDYAKEVGEQLKAVIEKIQRESAESAKQRTNRKSTVQRTAPRKSPVKQI